MICLHVVDDDDEDDDDSMMMIMILVRVTSQSADTTQAKTQMANLIDLID